MTRDEFGKKYLSMINRDNPNSHIRYEDGYIYSHELQVLRVVECSCDYEMCEGWVVKSPFERDNL